MCSMIRRVCGQFHPFPIPVPEKQEPIAAPAEASAVQASLSRRWVPLQPSLGSTLIANGIVSGSNPPPVRPSGADQAG